MDAEGEAVPGLPDGDRVVEVFGLGPVDREDHFLPQVQPPIQFLRQDPPPGEELRLPHRLLGELPDDAGRLEDRLGAVDGHIPVAVPFHQPRLVIPVALPPPEDFHQHPFAVFGLIRAFQRQVAVPGPRQLDRCHEAELPDNPGVKGAAHLEDAGDLAALQAVLLFPDGQLDFIPRQRPPEFGAGDEDVPVLPLFLHPDKAEGGL